MAAILIIDDDPNICNILVRLVQSFGHQTVVAHTLADGLASARDAGMDLVLLDLELPDWGTGWIFCRICFGRHLRRKS
ncbi:MAG: response regulator [Desulfobacterales bacterium]